MFHLNINIVYSHIIQNPYNLNKSLVQIKWADSVSTQLIIVAGLSGNIEKQVKIRLFFNASRTLRAKDRKKTTPIYFLK